ncbi:MAG: right-handed parallel beta-helix repeat-containing protein [Planctomycetota bacterium]
MDRFRPCLAGLIWLALGSIAIADTYYVDVNAAGGGDGSQLAPYQTIQAAINAASTGDTIEIAAGSYQQGQLTCSKGLTLRGAGSSATILDGDDTNRILYADAISGVLTIEAMTLTNGRSSVGQGGGLYLRNGTVTIQDCVISNHTAEDSDSDATGGAILASQVNLTLTRCVISGCSVSAPGGIDGFAHGGALYCYEGTTSLEDCELTGNTSTWNGGAIEGNNTTLTVSGCTFQDNQATGFAGGALELINCGGAIITRARFLGNQANAESGAVDLYSSSATIENCLFAGNLTTLNTAGVAVTTDSGATATLRHCTIAGHSGAAAVLVRSGTSLDIVNSILWDNSSGAFSSAGTLTVTYSDVEGGQAGTGNIDSDPLFVDSANGDYRLGTGSPCIDAGTTISDPPETDLEGDPRNVDGDSDSTATPDLGCDEFDLLVSMSGTRETGQTVHFDAMAPPAFEDHFVQIFFSLTNGSDSGGLTVPNSGGQKLMLDVDALFSEMLALSAYFRVQLDASGSGSTDDVVIPAGAPTGVSLYFAGLSWDLGAPGAFDFTPTQEIVLQ